MSTQRRAAFTLVELLVVIGIIALLVSILLPALNRARQHANLIDCQARLRQMGQAMHIYAANNKDLFPWSFIYHNTGHLQGVPDPYGGSDGAGGEEWWKWHYTLSQVMGVDSLVEEPDGDVLWTRNHPVFIDKDAVESSMTDQGTDGGATPWGWRSDYTANPRVMTPNEVDDLYPTAAGGLSRPAAKMSQRAAGSFTNSSEVMAIWDSPQWASHGNSAFDYSHSMQGWQWFWGTFYVLPPSPIGWVNSTDYWSKPIWPGQDQGDGKLLQKQFNRDYPFGKAWESRNGSPLWPSMFRFRHMNNTTLNGLFVDGHVESRKVGEVLLRDVCTNFK